MAEVVSTGVSHMCDNSTVSVKLHDMCTLSILTVRRSGQAGLRRRKRVKQGVCGVNVPLRTPKRSKRENVQWKRKSAIEEKTVEIYSREKAFSPTSVVIKTNPLFRTSGTPQRLPTNFKVC